MDFMSAHTHHMVRGVVERALTFDHEFQFHFASLKLQFLSYSAQSSRTYFAFSPRNFPFDKSISRVMSQFSPLFSRTSSTSDVEFAPSSVLSEQSAVNVSK